jgi:hypothetical protein
MFNPSIRLWLSHDDAALLADVLRFAQDELREHRTNAFFKHADSFVAKLDQTLLEVGRLAKRVEKVRHGS